MAFKKSWPGLFNLAGGKSEYGSSYSSFIDLTVKSLLPFVISYFENVYTSEKVQIQLYILGNTI